ncbi:DUF1573 domain-containing protein [Cognatitamlana onchidii]|uniref:DUF1573 domain-containing protein n=1 Tax=Cognatitamlana onchidii TaxID=2562860 RepID=UPI0010A5F620|nr:DUF1573 domain-containing protein [Algibacter onchidii]
MKHLVLPNKFIKSVLTATALVFILNLSFSQTSQNETNTGFLSFKTETIDYGALNQNTDGERFFSFTNTGEAPVVISNVKTSCGCTVPSYPKNAILPGESGHITIKYATSKIGVFSKSIRVISNAQNSNQILKIKGEILKSSI